MKEAATALAKRLGSMRAQSEDEFRRNADAFNQELDALLTGLQPRLDGLRGKKVLVLSNDFSALTHRFGVEEVRVTESPASRLTDVDVRHLREAARAKNVGSILIDSETPPAVVDDLAGRLDEVTVLTIDSLGSSAASGHNTYIGLLRYDLEQLARVR